MEDPDKAEDSLETGNPFLLSMIAVADHFIYANGALVYTLGQSQVRILIRRGSATEELVIDSRQLVQECIPRSLH